MLLCCSHAGQPAVFGHAVSRDEPSIQRLLHHNAAQTKSGRHAALSVSIGSVCAMMCSFPFPVSVFLFLSLYVCLAQYLLYWSPRIDAVDHGYTRELVARTNCDELDEATVIAVLRRAVRSESSAVPQKKLPLFKVLSDSVSRITKPEDRCLAIFHVLSNTLSFLCTGNILLSWQSFLLSYKVYRRATIYHYCTKTDIK